MNSKQLQYFAMFLVVIAMVGVSMTVAKPMDIYDELVDNNKLFGRMQELLEAIGIDDDDVRSEPATADDNMSPKEKCNLPVRKGACRALIPRWRYDPAIHDCREFHFGGCDGNANNFKNYRNCMEVCKGN